MIQIKDLENLMNQIRPHLKEYLKEKDLLTGGRNFRCPNNINHSNEDSAPSCNFWPNPDKKENFKCFACGINGDIFTAVSLLEGRPTTGKAFIYDTILYLADKYNISHKIDLQARVGLKVDKILNRLLDHYHKKYISNKQVIQYIKKRKWGKTIKFGYCDSKLFKKIEAKIPKKLIDKFKLGLLVDKLIIPLYNDYGKLVGFAARSLFSSPIKMRYVWAVPKSNILYNLDKARLYGSNIYLVEGFASVFTMIKNGIINTVAIGGTSFSGDQYRLLTKHNIKKVVLCFDNDEAGIQAETTTLRKLCARPLDFEVAVLSIPESGCKDPDEYILKYGVKKFRELQPVSLYERLIKLYILGGDRSNKTALLKYIGNQEEYTKQEKLIKDLAKKLSVSAQSVLKDLQKVSIDSEDVDAVSLLSEKTKFETSIKEFEEKAWRRGELLGVPTGFPLLDSSLDGLQDGVILIGGKTNVGKSAFCISLAASLYATNPDKYHILYISLDDPLGTVISRILAITSDLKINTVRNPKHKIFENKSLDEKVIKKLTARRERAVSHLFQIASHFVIKDSNQLLELSEIKKSIKIHQKLAGTRKLILFIDSLHKIKVNDTKLSVREKHMLISDTVKEWSNHYSIPIIAPVELTKGIRARPVGDDIKEAVDYNYDSDVILLIYNDYYSNSKSQLKITEAPSNKEYPVVEIIFSKNKFSDFKGRLYYVFYPDKSLFIECSLEDQNKFRTLVNDSV